jgi:uncharacterized membrane protein
MSTVSRSIHVDVPVAAAFQEWARFEELPRFLSGVREVRRLDERRLHWRAEVAGMERVWELEISDLVVERRIAWQSRWGPENRGEIVFEPLSPSQTLVTMTVRYDPVSFVEIVTDYLGVLGLWVDRNLRRFKDLMEQPDSTHGRLPPAEELVGQ